MTQIPEATQVTIASLYVGDLKPEVSEQTLWNLFSPFGQVLSVKVCRDSSSQASLGYGYVNFRTVLEAEKAMEHVNYTPIDGRPCRVMWSMRDSNRRKLGVGNLFIKNIDPMLDSKSLYQAFSAFGPVLSCKIAVDEYGLSKGYGFIQFYNEADAEKARIRSDGVVFMKKKLVVAKFLPRASRTDAKSVDPNQFTNVFVKNFGTEFKKEELQKLFSKFGEITSCVIQMNEDGQPAGYGFVNYADPKSAAEAVEKMHDFELPTGQKLFVSRAMKKLERQAFLRRQYEIKKQEYYKKYQSLNLYIKNFDESITDEKLAELFSEFGEIRSARVMKDESGKSKCFGFVCFSTPEEAEAAMNGMREKLFDGKPLYVSIAQSREERRKHLETQTYSNSFRAPIFPPGSVPFVYGHPPPMPFSHPSHFSRYSQGMPNRPSNRPMQPLAPPQHSLQGYPRGGRHPYSNFSNAPYSQGEYRPRSNVGNVRHSQQNMYAPRPQMQAAQPSVNHVATDNAPRPRRDDSKISQKPSAQVQAQSQPQDSQDFKTRVYNIARQVFTTQNFDMALLTRITGTVIEYMNKQVQSSGKVDDDAITKTVLSAYNSFSATQQQQVKTQ